ncbi:hypothetical protein CQP30_03545 [Yersinia pestis]|uniref:Uncharacterized protein n=3 Tax=Yersinia pseudotuberculosis complex TaxID=1649845 RepID=A0A3G5L204_YERPE|nr:hypothetical [Yersinia pestis KIM10+]ABP40704.1 conserved hypothetical protein [Yersinia pestis Pestoides F]ABS49356.1 hypothetical protein YpsIP31758_2608 [Yersinia pseudotuberculosis IP 31758]ADV99349.1 hypothetical protein YPC_2815 [Yersinia pestis biovar Medievalis str. Harbin 35]AXY32564.1 hypothetical protein CEQ20_03500 [Yersinia pseudotuberculosis]AYW81792.1 hypothetical protein EGX42_01655 [Yersinia pestis]EEO75061.1 hypothetical protein YP516_2947 [Yersinia pestis Nepal516]EEO81
MRLFGYNFTVFLRKRRRFFLWRRYGISDVKIMIDICMKWSYNRSEVLLLWGSVKRWAGNGQEQRLAEF